MATEALDPAQAFMAKISDRYKPVHDITARGTSSVQQFYCGATVFLTGGSGFLGKQLIEKLLRATKVTKIYVLLRCKKDKSVQQRLVEMLKDPVDIIFHLAATTRFDELLKQATFINIRGTREILALGKASKKLSLIKGWPNTYTFTKAVAEGLVDTMGKDLPICVVRPAIVVCAIREPNPGWVDLSCIYGASGYMYAVGLGVAHTAYGNHTNQVDVIPVDYVNNTILAAAWETARTKSSTPQKDEIKIYTIASAFKNPITWNSQI
ncbi:unnamed protein product [Spodoptera littoralis]|uniref:Fatty acyl-CoA reductase n=1 Tax=Spodoptera littoralis TaxID=7109 RepID=A0A9P0HYA5_SPOLI|nr:unnamed protein product [Spodoptera littoralis]CAH1636739.1 unnamed protein product [Spodoptera littoralis]